MLNFAYKNRSMSVAERQEKGHILANNVPRKIAQRKVKKRLAIESQEKKQIKIFYENLAFTKTNKMSLGKISQLLDSNSQQIFTDLFLSLLNELPNLIIPGLKLEPIIGYKTMYYHYQVLHKNYEVKLDETIRGTEIEKNFPALEELMGSLDKLPDELKEDVRFFGGGLINHNFFFRHLTKMKMSKKSEENIDSNLLETIEKEFTNLENLKKELTKSALKVRGSG
ncbi:23656_t:CDS:2 [Entrophospora sp. SA101]|nr:15091_t:CDS:2 [Entrophospora sp. SA101]CAJ0749006.1 23656_t:CDS:2 [Entrophospora sp. SA101]